MRVGILVGLACLLVPAPRAPLSAPGAPQPPTIHFDSLVVSPSAFSPNGDKVQDNVRISYRLVDTTTVSIFVTPRASASVVRSLLPGVRQNPGLYTLLTWDGRTGPPDTLVVPDGDYELHVDGVEWTSGARVVNQRQVRVDTQPAEASIDSLRPRVYTPTVAGTPSPPRIGVRITNSEPGDSLRVRLHVTASSPPRTYALRLQQSRQDLQGDGLYWAVCDSCASSRAVPDGIHRIWAVTSDPAGNVFASDTLEIDKDIHGPRPAIRHPSPGNHAYVQRADSLVGTAYDRHGVGAVHVVAGTDTLALRGAVPPGDSVFVFVVDVASRFAAEGRYPLRLTGVDRFGVTDQSTYEFVVDRTPPGKPELDPRPGPVSKTDEIDVQLRLDPLDRVYQVIRTGGALPADTTRAPSSGVADLRVVLRPGANPLTFATRDSALNVSPPETLTVVWETSRGLAVPERFHAGNSIQLHMGAVEGDGVEVRIYATDGSLVHQFEDTSRKLIYTFTWNLENPQGLLVKNGAYLLQARVRNPDGSVERWRKLIAVLE